MQIPVESLVPSSRDGLAWGLRSSLAGRQRHYLEGDFDPERFAAHAAGPTVPRRDGGCVAETRSVEGALAAQRQGHGVREPSDDFTVVSQECSG